MTWLRIAIVAGVLACVCGCKQNVESRQETPGREANPGSAEEAKTAPKALSESDTEFASRERLTNEQLLKLANRRHLQRLEIYDASAISNESWIAVLPSFPELRRLRIERGAVSDEVLAALSSLEKIEVLNLPHAEFSDTGLASVLALPKLILLRFGSPNVTDDGFQGIAQVESLRFVHLLSVPISDVGLTAFHKMDQLESLYIDNGKETEDGIRELLKEQPQLHFHRNQLHIAEDPNSDGH